MGTGIDDYKTLGDLINNLNFSSLFTHTSLFMNTNLLMAPKQTFNTCQFLKKKN